MRVCVYILVISSLRQRVKSSDETKSIMLFFAVFFLHQYFLKNVEVTVVKRLK